MLFRTLARIKSILHKKRSRVYVKVPRVHFQAKKQCEAFKLRLRTEKFKKDQIPLGICQATHPTAEAKQASEDVTSTDRAT